MIKGTYVFYEDGKEIYRSDNVVTKFGKRFLANYIAGNVSFNSKDLSVGIATNTEYPTSISNSRLGFEFYKSPINFGSIDIQQIFDINGAPVLDAESNPTFTYGVVYKTTLPQDLTGIINEVGIYPNGKKSRNLYDSKFISDFQDNGLWFDQSGYNPDYKISPSPRIGTNVVEWRFNTGDTTNTTKEYKLSTDGLDLSGYSANDTLTLAFNRYDTNSSAIKIKFYSSDTDYFYGTFNSSNGLSGTGNKILSVSMNSVFANKNGNPKAYLITKVGIELTRTSASSNSYIYLDGLRINDEDTFDADYGLISRSILSTPLTKIAGRQIDIEYRLSLGF
jgi:hypothetical protein